jgi:hypothetical protein
MNRSSDIPKVNPLLTSLLWKWFIRIFFYLFIFFKSGYLFRHICLSLLYVVVVFVFTLTCIWIWVYLFMLFLNLGFYCCKWRIGNWGSVVWFYGSYVLFHSICSETISLLSWWQPTPSSTPSRSTGSRLYSVEARDIYPCVFVALLVSQNSWCVWLSSVDLSL